MQEQTLETSDETIGIKLKVGVQTKDRYNKVYFDKDLFDIGDFVYVISEHQHNEILMHKKKADEYMDRINQLEHEVTIANIEDLKNQIKDHKQTIAEKDAFIKEFEKESYKQDATIKTLNDKIGELTTNLKTTSDELATLKDIKISSDLKTKKIDELATNINDLQNEINSKDAEIKNLKLRLDEIGATNDKQTKQLEDSIDESEHQQLIDKVAELEDKLSTSEYYHQYFKSSYENLIDSSDALANENENYKHQNEKLRNDNNAINETNKLLNENIVGLNTTFKETKQELTTNANNTEKELKETIKNMQSHIDELTDKYQSLLVLKDNIPPKQHYQEIDALKDELKDAEKEIDKLNGEIETKLAKQKSEMEIAHADEINQIQLEHTENKAQMLVAYNQELNNLKLQYNNLANDYNYLLNGVDSLTRINTFFNGKHNEIKKDKEPIQLMEIISEQLPPADENVLEFVKKD